LTLDYDTPRLDTMPNPTDSPSTMQAAVDAAVSSAVVSEKDLAEAVGVSYNLLYRWRSGERRVRLTHAVALVQVLRRRADEIMMAADRLKAALVEQYDKGKKR